MRAIVLLVIFWFSASIPSYALEASGNRCKVDNVGKFKDYPGVTIIAPIADVDENFFNELFENLRSIEQLTDYYALLPKSSYHMTTHNLHTAKEKRWTKYMSSGLERFKKIHYHMQHLDVRPAVNVENIITKKTIKLKLKVSHKHEKIIKLIAGELGLEDKIPDSFHITLAYLYRDISDTQLSLLQANVKSVFKNLMATYGYHEKTFRLQQASLYYFSDMTCYTPWNGESKLF